MKEDVNEWTLEIKPQNRWWNIPFREIISYKDLLFLFVRRDFISVYKQTILGPLWFFIQPLLTSLTFTIIFGKIAGLSTDGVPKFLFYLAGITPWNFFSESLNKTSNTFTQNANIFGKVYFPRLIVPLSVVVSTFLKLTVQYILFFGFWIYFYFTGNDLKPNLFVLLFPILMVLLGLLGLGFGILISSLTTKYRDFQFLVVFGVQLMMYASPIVYPLSSVPEKYKWLLIANPVTSIIETLKFGFFGKGSFSWFNLGYSFGFTVFLLLLSLIVFHKVEKSFMDTV